MKDLSDIVSRRLLPRVSRPGQYVDHELNARRPDVESAEVTVCLAFPDAYSIGASHLGTELLYHMLNDTPGVACDRSYCPQPDAEAVMREQDVPLFGWESRRAVGDFDVLGFALSYELCATNVLAMLDLAALPLRASERTDEHPLVIGGDALADTPEPLAEFFDAFIVGDGERPLAEFVEIVRRAKPGGASREDVLAEAARTIDACYVPRFYRPTFDAEGFQTGVEPARDDVPAVVHRAHVPDLSDSPAITAPLVPLSEAVHDRVTIEIMRGCPNGCRFCQAGHTRLPVRWRPVEEIVDIARKSLDATGYRQISLLSLSTSDYPHLDELIDRLNSEFAARHVSVSLPSLRVDSQLRQLPKLTSGVRKGGLTIAAEAGSERLRRAMRKNITEENMLAGVRAAFRAGFKSVKVYFMAGLPGETEDDIDEMFELCRRLSLARKDVDGHKGAINAGVSWFVPKPHTPMQWSPMRQADYFWSVRERLRALARRTPVTFKFHRIEQSLIEAVVCRGDRRVGEAIVEAWRAGARMDSWNEHFNYDTWTAAFAAAGVDPARYAHLDLPTDGPLPWDHVQARRSREFLLAERQRMLDALAE